MITLKSFSSSPRIKHGFFTREGGVSSGPYSSLNCSYGSGDSAGNVATNRQRILQKQGLSKGVLLTCHQVHSAKAVTVKEPWTEKNAPKVDGMATRIPWITLGVLTADCAPVLFADSVSSIIGAAHAGWQGALNGVLEATLAEMKILGSCFINI